MEYVMSDTTTKTPEELILKHLEDNGQKMSWLAKKIGLTVGHLHSVLKGDGDKGSKRVLTIENRKKINAALNSNY
jgi:hypothetical protein